MRKFGRLGLVGALALVGAVVLVAAGHGSSLGGRQHVAIQITAKDTDSEPGVGKGTFKLIVGPGKLGADRGPMTYAEGIYRRGTQDGQYFELGRGTDTLEGKAGTLVIRREDRLVNVFDRIVITGTWNAVSGTGAYAGVKGGGRHASLELASGIFHVQYEGILTVP